MKVKNKTMLRLIIILSITLLSSSSFSQQIHVNREWRDNYGDPVFNPALQPYGGDWTKSIIAANNEIITVAHTAVSGQGENLLLTRFDDSGTPIWQVDYNSSSTHNDYGINLFEASNGDIYVCGTTDNGGTTNFDVLVLVYDASGNLLYDTRYDGPDSKNDIPAAINVDQSASQILIAGTSESSSTSYDYLVLGYDLTLNLNWSNTYDYANLPDVAVEFIGINGKFTVAGASANSATDWDMTTVDFDESTGSYQGDNRMNYPGFGYDEIYAFRKDANDNLYATGKCSSNGTNYNIRTVKIDSTNTLIWSQTYDGFGLEDIGSSLAIDLNGNVIVCGYITKSNNKKDLIILKYNPSGTLLWTHTQPSNDPNGDAVAKSISLNPSNGNIYFIGGEKELGGSKRVIVGRVFPNGVKGWERWIRGSYDHLPSDIQYGGLGTPGVFAITIKDSTVNQYELSLYTEHQMDTAKVYTSNGSPAFLSRTLIVKLDTSALKFNKIDDTEIRAGSLSDFLKTAAVNSIQANLATVCENDRCDIKVYKIFPQLTSSMNKAVSRLGDTVNVPQFYSALLFEFPANVNVVSAANSLNTLEPLVKYSHPDHFTKPYGRVQKESMTPYSDDHAKTTSVNDPEYGSQRAVHFVTPYDSAHVNTEPAWNYSTGKPYIRVGVFDSGIDWNHEDFGNGTASGSKIINGWSFQNNSFLKNNQNGDGTGHGTAVAGIIGAIRNNSKGVAGIAGGNYNASFPIDSSGVSLYGLRIYGDNFYNIPYDSVLHYVYDAIVSSAMTSNPFYGYGLHVMNNSWGIGEATNIPGPLLVDTNITLLRESVHFANRMKVTFVAARGNLQVYPNNTALPANLDDDWVLTVGGTGTTGWYNTGYNFHEVAGDFPTIGNNEKEIDVSAPYTFTLNRIVLNSQNNTSYGWFGGTSASAPHVAGAVGLLMSYLNLPYPANSNLAPEDCEAILQLSASDCDYVSWPGYDTMTGWGRLNIGKAMQMVDKSKYKLSHYGIPGLTNTRTRTAYPQTTVKLEERYQNYQGNWFAPKYYKLTPYKITATISHNLPAYDTVKAYWPRPSSSELLDSIANGKIYPRERVKIESLNLSTAVVSGYVYKVKDSLGTTDLGWWPFDTTGNSGKIAYSILRYDTTSAIGVKEDVKINNSVSIYPNPTNNTQILNVSTPNSEPINIDLFDVTGRLVLNVYSGKTNRGTTNYTANLSKFDSGVYFYRVRIKDDEKVFKVIKQ